MKFIFSYFSVDFHPNNCLVACGSTDFKTRLVDHLSHSLPLNLINFPIKISLIQLNLIILPRKISLFFFISSHLSLPIYLLLHLLIRNPPPSFSLIYSHSVIQSLLLISSFHSLSLSYSAHSQTLSTSSSDFPSPNVLLWWLYYDSYKLLIKAGVGIYELFAIKQYARFSFFFTLIFCDFADIALM